MQVETLQSLPHSGFEMKMIDHPLHYRSESGHEAIDVIEAWNLCFNLGNALKYISRCGLKGSSGGQKEIEDLEKAKWYIERQIAIKRKLLGQP